MAMNYINSPEKDFSLGIDARSAENQIDPGFVRDLLNADIVEKRVRTRKGHQGYAGNIPVRVTSVTQDDTTNELCFTLDSAVSLSTSISLETVRSTPLVVYGRSSVFTAGQGPFITTSDTVKYYSSFTVPTRKMFNAPSGTLEIPGAEHGLGTINLFINVVESTSVINRSYELLLPDTIDIDESTFDVDIDYTTSVDRDVFVYFADKDTVTGSSYVASMVHTGSGSETFTIPAATHSLANFNIVMQFQQDIGSERSQIIPDEALILPNGDVEVTINSSTAGTFYGLLSAAPLTNVVTGVVNASSTGTVVISAPENPWIFYGIYLEQTPGGNKEIVYPDSIVYDEVNNEVTLSFVNSIASARNFTIFYEYGDVRSNQLCVVDASITVTGSDPRPQLSIWGLDHDEIYTTRSEREGWVNHIDSYRRSGEQRLVSGLGGNLFSARTYSEAATTYAYPLLYTNLQARTTTNRILGPLFYDTGDTPARSRGYITADASGTNWASITAVEYDSGNGWTKYTIALPNKQVLDSSGSPTILSSVISTTTNLEDWLTVQSMSYVIHNGTFKIKQIQDDTNKIYVWVENEENTSDWNDSGTAGEAGVFTDQFTWTTTAPFIPQDQLVSDALGDTFVCNVLSTSSTTTVSDGFLDLLQVPGGVLFNGARTSSVIPLRTENPGNSPSTTNLVRGDMLSYTGIDRLLRVKFINADQTRTVNITASSGTATAELQSGDTTFLTPGMSIVLNNAGVYTGVVEITDIISATEFTFDTEEVTTVNGASLIGETIQVDEELMWEDTPNDSNLVRVEKRWIPLEAPDDSFNETPSTYVRYFDTDSYTDQPFLRSTMVVDNMYFTNSEDEVYKLDGSNIYRAGIIPWQPGAFLTQETGGSTIVVDLRTVAFSAVSAAAGKVTIARADLNTIPVGIAVRLNGSTETYTIRSYEDDGTNAYIVFDRSLDAGVSAGNASEIGTYRYYYRLNAVDANSNLIASAVTTSQDYVVELTTNAAVQHKLIGLPAWDVYDYDRLEVQIYRTKLNQPAPFYLVATIPMDFDRTQGYVNYTDSFADTDLTELDVINTALKGTELGTSWSDPLKAKYITSIGNRAVLANITDYPQLDIQVVAPASISNSAFAGDTLLFRKDNTDSGTTTNMLDRVKYQWINGFTGTASTFVIGTNEFTFTTSAPTNAVAGDWIYLTYDTVAITGRDLTYSGWWQIEAVAGADVTVNLVGAATAATYPNRYVIATDPTDVPVLLGVDGNLGMFNGDSFDLFDSMRRMSLAINASMRMVDTTQVAYDDFTPWLVARGGNDFSPAGRLIVRQPRADQLTFELVPTFSGYDLFVNSIKRATGAQISASSRVFASRIIASYENYPEIFDNPTTILDSESDSAIDINSADGQEITGVIPFFGEAAFGAAQQSSILVVFKTNSVYLVDLNEKAQGRNPVQRIETEGLGCTAPYSIAVTKGGIMFANESGIYCLRRNQAIQYIGRFMERNWTELVSLENLDLVQGHHYGVGRVYKLSVPLEVNIDTTTGYLENSDVFVYNHTSEAEGRLGAWSRYDNHRATGWANLGSDAFFGATSGRVFSIRNTGTETDFRDDSEAFTFRLDTRPNDFGNSGIRKILDKVIVHYRTGAENTGTSVSYSVDLEQAYDPSTPVTIPYPAVTTGLDDRVARDVVTITHSLARRRGVYFGVRIENSTMDENLEIAGVDYRVGGLQERGILQAAQTEED